MCFINFHIRNHLKYKLSKMISKIIGDSDRHILLRYVFQITSFYYYAILYNNKILNYITSTFVRIVKISF